MIDFAGQLRGLENVAQAYADLSVNGDAEEAATGLFAALRWAEAQPSAKRLIICSEYTSSKYTFFGVFNLHAYSSVS